MCVLANKFGRFIVNKLFSDITKWESFEANKKNKEKWSLLVSTLDDEFELFKAIHETKVKLWEKKFAKYKLNHFSLASSNSRVSGSQPF